MHGMCTSLQDKMIHSFLAAVSSESPVSLSVLISDTHVRGNLLSSSASSVEVVPLPTLVGVVVF